MIATVRRAQARSHCRRPFRAAAAVVQAMQHLGYPVYFAALLGAWKMSDGSDVNFALFSENASAVELCLFNGTQGAETGIPVTEQTDQEWHVYLPELRPEALYGYRVHGA
jgi:pullulanase/glycogen debranching enzyme